MPIFQPIILTTLTITTFIFLSSTHLVLMWVSLELSTLVVLPLIANKSHPRAIEASTKYFLTQATASALMIFSGTLNYITTGNCQIMEMTNQTLMIIMILAMFIKVGLVPFHFWVPETIQGMSPTASIFLLTWQKLGPLILLFLMSPLVNFEVISVVSILSVTVAGWLGLNQTQIRKLVALSSIAQMAWTVIIIKYAPSLTILAFYVYSITISTTLLTLEKLSTTSVSSLLLSFSKAPITSSLLTISLLSLSGLPPLAGFLPKWLTIDQLVAEGAIWITFVMLMASLLSLFFYLRLWYNSASTLPPNATNTKRLWRKSTQQTNLTINSMATAAMTLILAATLMKAITKQDIN
uniref:NADH-ubiquinone oxidoreductase chain 2 n=1 Tax=Mecistops cataphractus TaxID=184780 RepID=B2WVJ8_9SAUR|nr:NADH dehydrogenase subunit 2 [Mecistops cataphractus]ABP62963.1 NADH dehydrogenase subunit 2 [Mecistops cataphractus]AER37355.1 NADH dehydrogenase subunit 2 [Mecistops cataphractus]AER37372.1 NADH dehydrogenase subunit 2 [Mecistops cataphractus]AER37374.1 NADH dehydrogenase subunit 2 [Mecistops cataphractus]QOI74185.1 NADH dehydrogenase subunit 2 [Mecistops cataphractus]